jgi:hypothetical protein
MGPVRSEKAALEVGQGALARFGSARSNIGEPAWSLSEALKEFKVALVGFAQGHVRKEK